MTFPPLVTAVCTFCRHVRVGLTSADLRLAGWKRFESGTCACPACVKRAVKA